MLAKCDKCGKLSEIYFHWESVFSIIYQLKFCRTCGKELEKEMGVT